MVAPPGRFNDCLDCVARIIAPPPKEIIEEYYNKQKDWFDIAVQGGLRGQQLVDFLNYPNKAPSQERYLEVVQDAFRSHKPLDKVFRILCLCDADNHPDSDKRMWRMYAQRSGVRIGLNVDLDSTDRQFVFRKVKYESDVPAIDLSFDEQITTAFDYLDIIATKTTVWQREREWRLCLLTKYCRSRGGREFLAWDREMLHSVDIGCGMNVHAQKGLIRMIRDKFAPEVTVRIMNADRKYNAISYEHIRK